MPLPLPLAPAVTVNHDAPLDAVQRTSRPAVNATLVPPAAGTPSPSPGDREGAAGRLGDREGLAGNRHGAGPRGRAVFAAAKRTVPLPLPLAPLVIVIHDALLDAVHAQPAGLSPRRGAVRRRPHWSAGLIAKCMPPPACVTVKVWPPMVSVPVRESSPVFAATLKPTVPLPLPLAPPVTVIQEALLDRRPGAAGRGRDRDVRPRCPRRPTSRSRADARCTPPPPASP